MQKKKGISLITLVITIIVMIIIAGVIIFTLSDSDIFNKANEAVAKTNLNQIQTWVTTLWAEAYLDPDITADEDYRRYVEEGLSKNGVNLNEYVFEITSKGAKVEGPDITKPTISLTADKQGVGKGGTLTYTVTFNDNKEVAAVDFDASDVTITGFTADVTVTGEGNTRTLTLSNIQGELGEKTVTIRAGVAKDVAGNVSNATTVKFSIVETLGALITSAEMYGTKINYEANGITDWKVFYSQTVNGEEYVYLIASEKLPYSAFYDSDEKLTVLGTKLANSGATISSATVGTKTVGQIYWNSDPAGIAVAATAKDKWLAKWPDYTANTNGKCVSYFLDENIWSDFANTEGYKDTNGNSYVVGAIGTPTAEMFVASWNAKRLTETNTSKVELTLTANETTGYYVNGSPTTSITKSDPLYIWSTGSNSDVWLASPAGGSTNALLRVGDNGDVGGGGRNYPFYGVRPVVCLKSNIPVSLVDGNFVIK